MNHNLSIPSASKTVRVLNIVILAMSVLTAFGVIALNFSREFYSQISSQIFSPEKPLMNSVILDLLMRKGVSFVILILVILMIIKEKRIASVQRRLRINLLSFVGLAAYTVFILYLVYLPIFNAN